MFTGALGITMSADNWRTCPRCTRTAKNSKDTQKKKCAESYGKVAAEKFLQMLADSEKPVELDDSMREDYDIGIDDTGEFGVSYRAYCGTCGFTFSYTHEEKTPD